MSSAKRVRLIAVLATLGVIVAACDGNGADLTTTSTLVGGAGSGDGGTVSTTTTVVPAGETTTTTVESVGTIVDSFDIVSRVPGDAGDTVYIVIPQGAYTDVDLENFVGDLIEEGIVTWEAEIFDDALAVDALMKDEADRSEEEVELLAQHHFASVLNGDTLRFQGPFEDSGEFVIGS